MQGILTINGSHKAAPFHGRKRGRFLAPSNPPGTNKGVERRLKGRQFKLVNGQLVEVKA